ncbi:type IV pilus modification protein PilV [Vreelandella aquamarina]|jgi:type IV pilus assembly protein PilV|uniref:Type IV pilus assembly protein PilV n=1 Tax=Vreelandella aquamarina TaxID=77097 RepID=A0A1H8P0N3_9GAMM|nr:MULTISPECIES: type IV pilus modification protein PilV [Halomonas]SEO35449.1 type IV pilus assembly protein PilV [Halomonas aquamarina]
MKHQQGFSLIEVLIALVVLAFGLMGVAAMQIKALQSATEGYQRSVVTLAAVDAQERLWAQLAQETSCDDMVDNILSDWQSSWFADSDTPIRHFSGGIELGTAECEFNILITLNDNDSASTDETFTYTFRLPDLLGN